MKEKYKEAAENHLMNIKYLKENPRPTPEQLEKMYGHLNYCLDCGKPIKNFEAYSHCFLGNRHKFGCTRFRRFLGRFYVIGIRALIFAVILGIFYLVVRLMIYK